MVRTRPQGGPPTARVQEKAAECGPLGLVISWVEEQPFQSSRGQRVPGPCARPASLPTSSVRTAAAAKPLPLLRLQPLQTPSGCPLEPLRSPGAAPSAGQGVGSLASRSQSFEALPHASCILSLSAPSATQGAHNNDSEECTNGSPSHLAWNPEVRSRDQPHLPPQPPHLRQGPRAHIRPLARLSAGMSRAHSLVHCFSRQMPSSLLRQDFPEQAGWKIAVFTT